MMRAWDKVNNVMRENVIITPDGGLTWPGGYDALVDKYTCMEYSQHEDAVGRRVCEGDICQARIPGVGIIVAEVIYKCSQGFCLKYGDALIAWNFVSRDVQIMGNKYANTDLMEEVKKAC